MCGFHKTYEIHLKITQYSKAKELKFLLDQKACLSQGVLESSHHKGHSVQNQGFYMS